MEEEEVIRGKEREGEVISRKNESRPKRKEEGDGEEEEDSISD